MSSGNPDKPDLLTMYQLHRERITQEDTLTHYRMLWMISSQTILFVLWGGLFTAEVTNKTGHIPYFLLKIFEGVLCFIAIVAAIGSWFSISAADQEIKRIKDLYDKVKENFKYSTDPKKEIFGMVVGEDVYHTWGHIVTNWGPWFFVTIWTILLILFVLLQSLTNVQGIGAIT